MTFTEEMLHVMLYNKQGHVNWVTKLINYLFKSDFGEVWISQVCGNKNLFLKLSSKRPLSAALARRLIEQFKGVILC